MLANSLRALSRAASQYLTHLLSSPLQDALGSQFSVADIVVLLTHKNLGAYASMFKKNKVDGAKFITLTEDDLKSFGIGVRNCSDLHA